MSYLMKVQSGKRERIAYFRVTKALEIERGHGMASRYISRPHTNFY